MGQGYVGLPVAIRALEAGYSVIGFDTDPRRVKRLASADSYVEDVSNDELASALRTGRYLPTDRIEDCVGFDVGLITVPTPLKDGLPDLSFVEEAARILGKCVKTGACVILESTTYPGTTEELVGPVLEAESGLRAGEDFHLGYSPERIDPGNENWRFVNTPKIVSGVNKDSLNAVKAFYDSLIEKTVVVSGTGEAELAKLIENTFRHVNVALVNEMAMFAGDLGIDIWESIRAASTKPFGFMRFEPGPGVGGHCLPIDPSYLSWRVKRRAGTAFRFVELANDVNDHMPEYVVRRLMMAMNHRARHVKGLKVLLLGLAYKPNSSDARQSPALIVADRLVSLGAEVRAADPHVDAGFAVPGVTRVDFGVEEVRASDAVVLLTAHDAFDLGQVVENAPFVLDARGRLEGDNVERI
jgi:UDP-N-acetyl-D-glucosamine dehydrogenase